MTRQDLQDMFERIYADLHAMLPEVVRQHRFTSHTGYNKPEISTAYRLFLATCDALGIKEDNQNG